MKRFFSILVFLSLFVSPLGANARIYESNTSTPSPESLSQKQEKWAAEKNISNGLNLANAYYKSANYQGSLAIAEEVFQLDRLTADEKAKILYLKVINFIKLKLYDTQDKSIEQANLVVNHVQDDALKVQLFEKLGQLKIKQFKIKEAQELYLQAIELTDKQNLLGQVYEELGITYAQQGKFPQATESMLASIKINEDNNKAVPYSAYLNLGGLSLYTQNWDQAIRYLLLGIEKIKGETLHKSDAYSNLGNAYFYKGDKEQAYNNYKRSLQISDALGAENAWARNNFAYLLMEQGDYETALKSFKRLEAIHIKADDADLLSVARKNIGEAYIGLGERRKAAEYFEQAYKIYISNNFVPKLLELYPVMIDNYESLNEFSRALALSKEFKSTSDETVNVESKAKIAELESAFELEKKNKELAESEKANSELAHQQALKDKNLLELRVTKQEQQQSIYVLIFVVVILLLAGFFLLRINKLRAKANSELLQKNKEIEQNQSELETLNEKLEQQSLEDELTGLKNRRYLDQMMPREKARLNRELTQGTINPSLVIMLDIDYFKRINDSYGHSVGDQVLQAFAEVMKANARHSDMQIRWGGEEFLWYCPGTSLSDGEHLCKRVSEQLKTVQIKVGRGRLSPTCSFGYASYPMFQEADNDWELTIQAADAALYRAKALGRNRWIRAKLIDSVDNSDTTLLNIDALLKEGKISLD